MNAADILDRAADIMQERGKSVGDYARPNGSVCVVGACAMAEGVPCIASAIDKWWDSHNDQRILRYVRASFNTVASWSDDNDAPTVIAGLRAVAVTLRAQQSRLLPVVIEREAEHV